MVLYMPNPNMTAPNAARGTITSRLERDHTPGPARTPYKIQRKLGFGRGQDPHGCDGPRGPPRPALGLGAAPGSAFRLAVRIKPHDLHAALCFLQSVRLAVPHHLVDLAGPHRRAVVSKLVAPVRASDRPHGFRMPHGAPRSRRADNCCGRSRDPNRRQLTGATADPRSLCLRSTSKRRRRIKLLQIAETRRRMSILISRPKPALNCGHKRAADASARHDKNGRYSSPNCTSRDPKI